MKSVYCVLYLHYVLYVCVFQDSQVYRPTNGGWEFPDKNKYLSSISTNKLWFTACLERVGAIAVKSSRNTNTTKCPLTGGVHHRADSQYHKQHSLHEPCNNLPQYQHKSRGVINCANTAWGPQMHNALSVQCAETEGVTSAQRVVKLSCWILDCSYDSVRLPINSKAFSHAQQCCK